MSSLEERREWKERIIVNSFVLFVLNILDMIGTTNILGNGGIELNPLVNYVWSSFGFWLLIMVKLGFPLLLMFVGVFWFTKHPVNFYDKGLRAVFKQGLLMLNIIYGVVVIFMFVQLVIF